MADAGLTLKLSIGEEGLEAEMSWPEGADPEGVAAILALLAVGDADEELAWAAADSGPGGRLVAEAFLKAVRRRGPLVPPGEVFGRRG